MPNAYVIKAIGRHARRAPDYHQPYYFFNSNYYTPAFITTPNLYYMNQGLKSSTNARFIKQRLADLTGGAPYGEARARRMVNNTLRQRTAEMQRPRHGYNIESHQRQIKFYQKLRNALGNGNMTVPVNQNVNNKRINNFLVALIKKRLTDYPKHLSNINKYNQITIRQKLLLNHSKASKNMLNRLVAKNIRPANVTNITLANLSTQRNNLGQAIRDFFRTKAALSSHTLRPRQPSNASRRRKSQGRQ